MKTYSKNRKAFHDFIIEDTFEAGLSLTGPEVKSIRAGNVSLKGSYISVTPKKAVLKQVNITKPDNLDGYSNISFIENREIPLLLQKKEILKLFNEVKQERYSIIPLEIYQRENTKYIKIKIALAKGKREYDKRHSLKEKQAKIDTNRALKGVK